MAAEQRAPRRAGVNVFDSSRPMWQTMLVFLIPLMISNVLQSTSQTFSYVFLGRMLGVNALAAVSAVFPVVFLLFSFLIGIGSGATVLIGQAYGASDQHRVKRVAGTVLGATVVFSIITMILGVVFSPVMLKGLGTPASILPMSDYYTRVVFLTFPLYFPYIMYTVFLRGTGDTRTPLAFLVLGTALSVFFTPMLIRGWFGLPTLGVASVAVSGLLSTLVSFPALLWYLRRTRNPLAFDAETARDMVSIDGHILALVLKIGIPTGLQTIMVSLAEIAVISFVNRYGPSATAAYGAVNQVIGYVQFPAISMSITASIFGAQCIGARRQDLLGSVVRSAVALNYAVGGILIAICYIFAYPILGWFITDRHTLEIAHGLLMITLWSYLLFGNSAVLSGVVRSSGDVIWPTINAIFAIWGIEVPAAYILMHYYGLPGVWMGYPISYAFVLCAQFTYYQFFWKKKPHERLI